MAIQQTKLPFTERLRFAIARSLYSISVKAAPMTWMPEWMRHYWTSTSNYKAMVEEGFRVNSAVFACMGAFTTAITEPRPMVVDQAGEETPRPDVAMLLERPNPDMDWDTFIRASISYMLISGNAYGYIELDAFDQPIAIWPLSDYNVLVHPGTNTAEGIVLNYEIHDGSQVNGVIVPKDRVIHWRWTFDPGSPWIGRGPLQAAARDVDTDNTVGYYAFNLLKNDATPRVVVTLVEGEDLTPEKANRLRMQWQQKYGGDNLGAPAFLEAGMTVNRIGFSINELAYSALRQVPESRIAAAFRVPPIIANLLVGMEYATYSNYAEARQAFTEDVLIPIWKSFVNAMNMRLVPWFGGGFSIAFDFDDVRSLQDDVDAKWTRVTTAFNAGLITRADALRELGMAWEETDEVYKIGMTTFFQPRGTLDQPIFSEPDEPQKALPGQKHIALLGSNPSGSSLDLKAAFDGKTYITTYLNETDAAAIIQEASSLYTSGQVEMMEMPLHVTLAVIDQPPSLSLYDIVDTVASSSPFIIGETRHPTAFPAKEDGSSIVYLPFVSANAVKLRERLVDALTQDDIPVSTDKDFIPHISLGVAKEEWEPIDIAKRILVLNQVTVQFDEQRVDIPIKADDAKVREAVEFKASLTAARRYATALIRARKTASNQFEKELQKWFNDWSDTVVNRASGWKAEQKALPSADDLLRSEDVKSLTELVKRWYLSIARTSWESINLSLGMDLAFDLTDPAITKVLDMAGTRVVGIVETTRVKLTEVLQHGNEEGWSIGQLVRGDPEAGVPGIRDVVAETYKGRASTIARTELGEAQNTVALERYKSAEVKRVLILDDGFDDSHETCIWIDGQERDFDWTNDDHPDEGPLGVKNPLQHPNCVRAFAPIVL